MAHNQVSRETRREGEISPALVPESLSTAHKQPCLFGLMKIEGVRERFSQKQQNKLFMPEL